MKLTVAKAMAPKLSRCLMNNEMIEVIDCHVQKYSVTYVVDAPDFFDFPHWVEVEA